MTDIDIKEFMYSSFSNMHETIKEIKETLKEVNTNLKENTDRISAVDNKIDGVDIKHSSDVRSVKWIFAIIAFFIVTFALFLQENIKSYNKNLIQNQLNSEVQKKTENSTTYTNNVNVK